MKLLVFLSFAGQLYLLTQTVPVPQDVSPAQPREQLARFAGKVLNAQGGIPIANATLMLQSQGSARASKYVSVSGSDGAFVFDRVEPGTYSLYAERRGFLGQYYGARSPGGHGTPLTLPAAGKEVLLKLTPQGIISGKVTDEVGEPVDKASVVLMHWGHSQGKRVLVVAGGGFVNDLGEYRVAGISPGSYYIAVRRNATKTGFTMMRADVPSARLPAGPEEGYQTTYYPSSISPDGAGTVQVVAGAEINGVDIQLRKARVFRVRGRVQGAAGTPVAEARVALVPEQPKSILAMSSLGGQPIPGGEFEITGVLPGSYELAAEVSQGGHTLYARQLITVTDHDVADIVVRIPVLFDVHGRVRVDEEDGQGTLPLQKFPLERLRVWLLATAGLGIGIPEAPVQADGSFILRSIVPDRFRVSVSGISPGWYVKSILVGGTDCPDAVANFPGGDIDVVLAMGTAELAGTVRGDDDKPVPDAAITVIPDQESNRGNRYRATESDQNGQFKLTALVPGRYRIFAWEDLDLEAAPDPELLQYFESKAIAVDLAKNGNETVQLKIIPTEEVANVRH